MVAAGGPDGPRLGSDRRRRRRSCAELVGVALTTFIVAGVLVVLGAVVGATPRGSIKEGNVEWPDLDSRSS
jgi:hypothetical protein